MENGIIWRTFNTSFKLLDIFLYTDNMYRFNNIDSGDLKVLLNTFNINIIPKAIKKQNKHFIVRK